VLQSADFTPARLIDEILYRMPYALTEESSLRFECNCSLVRVIAGLATLKAAEIQSLVDDGGMLEISCDFCGKNYEVPPEQLRGLLKSN
jgi:molecular chaperone Hsp33